MSVDDKKIIFSMVGVSKAFQANKQVLKDIYLSFFYGAKIGIIGLNGSGKSTLLKIIAGLEKSYQGEVVFSPGYSVGYLVYTIGTLVTGGDLNVTAALGGGAFVLAFAGVLTWLCLRPVKTAEKVGR